MAMNLLQTAWTQLDSHELRLLLDERIGGPGQYDDREANPQRIHLPLAGTDCRVTLTYSGQNIASVEPGQAFDQFQWEAIAEELATKVLAGPERIGREYSFCSYRVSGSWRGDRSGVQILPPHPESPTAPVECADHPFILEFPIRGRRPLADYQLPKDAGAPPTDADAQHSARRSDEHSECPAVRALLGGLPSGRWRVRGPVGSTVILRAAWAVRAECALPDVVRAA